METVELEEGKELTIKHSISFCEERADLAPLLCLSMGDLIARKAAFVKQEKEIKTFRIKEDDLKEFRAFAKKNVLFSAIKDMRANDGTIDLVTNTDFLSQVNLFMERRGYAAPVSHP